MIELFLAFGVGVVLPLLGAVVSRSVRRKQATARLMSDHATLRPGVYKKGARVVYVEGCALEQSGRALVIYRTQTDGPHELQEDGLLRASPLESFVDNDLVRVERVTTNGHEHDISQMSPPRRREVALKALRVSGWKA